MGEKLTARRTHLYQIDLVRIFAIISVIICHCVQAYYPLTVNFVFQNGIRGTAFALVLLTFGRLGVPLFLMITGYLLLDREYTGASAKRFYAHNWLRLILTVEIWAAIYTLFLTLVEHEEFHELDLLEELFFVRNVNLTHWWYLPMILGVYLLIPLIAKALQNFDQKALLFPLVIIGVYTFCVPILSIVLIIFGYPEISIQNYESFGISPYILYMISGYFIKKGVLKEVKSIYLIIISAAGFIIAYLFQLFAFTKLIGYTIWYDNGMLLLIAVPLFELFTRRNNIKLKPVVKELAKLSFGVYLVHQPVRILVMKLFYWTDEMPLQVALTFIVTTIISFAIVFLLSRIPKVGNVLFYIKGSGAKRSGSKITKAPKKPKSTEDTK